MEIKDRAVFILAMALILFAIISRWCRCVEMKHCMKEMEQKGYSYYDAKKKCNSALDID